MNVNTCSPVDDCVILLPSELQSVGVQRNIQYIVRTLKQDSNYCTTRYCLQLYRQLPVDLVKHAVQVLQYKHVLPHGISSVLYSTGRYY